MHKQDGKHNPKPSESKRKRLTFEERMELMKYQQYMRSSMKLYILGGASFETAYQEVLEASLFF